jgi:outer membrane protein OmpA-like peptidoglycan-associated protein
MAFQLVTALAGALALAGQAPEPMTGCGNFYVFFAPGSARLDRGAITMLDNWAIVARRLDSPRDRYTIEARTDATGAAASNLDLSWRRGRAIMRYLTGLGFPAERFRIHAVGESRQMDVGPAFSAHDERVFNRSATPLIETPQSNWRRVFGDVLC